MWSLTHFKAQQKVLINGCDTCFDDILDKMNELQEHQKIMICKLLMVNLCCAIRRCMRKVLFSDLKFITMHGSAEQ